MTKPCIAIVGRPNVGKSTLFNRIVRRRQVIVADEAGVTRDRIFADACIHERDFLLVDTGGIVFAADDEMQAEITGQSLLAVAEADAVIFLLDGLSGPTPDDHEVARQLRQVEKPIFWVVNKVDSDRAEADAVEFYQLGIDHFFTVSAAHGRGVGDLLDAVAGVFLPTAGAEEKPSVAATEDEKEKPLRVAVIGKPNVGKSSLLNRFAGGDRLITSDRPGTTRDAVELPLERRGKSYLFFDTAGLRRRSKVTERLETYGNIATLRSIDFARVVVLMIDAAEGLTDQDIRLATLANDKGKAILFVFNKIDTLPPGVNPVDRLCRPLAEQVPFIHKPDCVAISVRDNRNITKLFPFIDGLAERLEKRITTGVLNRTIREITDRHQHPLIHHHPLKFFYATQIRYAPPGFVIFCNTTDGIRPSYVRYLTKNLMERLGLTGIPLRITFKKR
ncbi:MAG: ribosome biogenesis GTPase Der [Deltaproteobacteria bacterium]|nr:ribosome biogenesis GTPase Der [Candidatus Anaeroferrophillacea bacterium]